MGLISKEVEVRLVAQNIKYYENLGYTIPRKIDKNGCMCVPMNSTITVSIDDLPLGSGVFVDLKCDCCNKPYKLKYQNYNKHNHNGKIYCKNCSPKIFLSGKNHPSYNENKTDEERLIERNYPEYINFVKCVLLRDNYTCQCCGVCGGKLEVHHLDGYNWCVEKRCDINNGLTLCKNCHSNFHAIYGYGDNTKQQFEDWINHTIELINDNIEIEPSRKVYCYEDDIIFDNAKKCAKYYGVTVNCIYNVLKGKVTLAVNKHFIWYDKYINLSEPDKKIWLKPNPKWKKIICITTGETFDNIKSADKKYKTKITRCLKGCRKHTGKLPDGTPLQWTYYEDFLKLPIEEQNEILSRNKDSSNDGSFLNCTER